MLEVYQSTNSAPVLVGFEGRETVLPACTVAGLIAVPPTVSNVTVYVVFSFIVVFVRFASGYTEQAKNEHNHCQHHD